MNGRIDLIVSRHVGAIKWLCDTFAATGEKGEWRTKPGGIRFFREEFPSRPCGSPEDYGAEMCPMEAAVYAPTSVFIPVRAEVGLDDVRGKHVVGNLPLHLAALCASVIAIEFTGCPRCANCNMEQIDSATVGCAYQCFVCGADNSGPPRGAEYTALDMERAGARLVRYQVSEYRC